MNHFQMLISTNPALAVLVPILAAAVPMTLFFSYAGMSFMVGCLQVKALRSDRSMYDKAGKQLATLALILAWVLLIASRVWIFVKSDSYVPQSFLSTMIELSWGIYGFAVIASSIHFAVWKPLTNHKGIHSFLAFFAGLNGLFSLFVVLAILRLVTVLNMPEVEQVLLADLFQISSLDSPLLKAAVLVLPLAFAMPPLAGLVWLILRRNRDDYGRDYYRTMLAFCARWAFVAWVLVTLMLSATVALDLRPLSTATDPVTGATTGLLGALQSMPVKDLLFMAGRLMLPVIICVTMRCIIREAQPMRLKPWVVLAFFLATPIVYYLFVQAMHYVPVAAAAVAAPIQ